MFQPDFQMRAQPRTRQTSRAAGPGSSLIPVRAREGCMAALGGTKHTDPRKGDESPGRQSDFSAHTIWEEDWSDNELATVDQEPPEDVFPFASHAGLRSFDLPTAVPLLQK